MRRRHFLMGGAAVASVSVIGATGCAGGNFSRTAVARTHPPIGEFADTPLGRVHYWDRGEGPVVVLIHGASGNLRDWTHAIAPKLAERFRVIALDRPGFGYSDRAKERGWHPEVQAAQLRAAVETLNVERPVIVGHSWGAAVALAWALDAPETITGVVAVSGAVMPFSDSKSIAERIGLDGLAVAAYQRYLRATAGDGGIARFVTRAFRPQQPPPGYIDYVGGELALRDGTLAANSQDLQYLNRALREIAPRYGELTVPVEIVHGAEDWLLNPGRHAIPLARRAPNARLTILEGVGHMAHHGSPMAVEMAIAGLHGIGTS